MNAMRLRAGGLGLVVAATMLWAIGPAAGEDGEELLGATFMDQDTGITFRPPAGCVFAGKPKTGQVGQFVNAQRTISMTVSYEDLAYRPDMAAHLDQTVKVVSSRFGNIRIVGQTVFRVGVWPAGQWVGTSGSGAASASHVQVLLQTGPQRVFLFTLRRAGVDTHKALALMSAVRSSIGFADPEELAEKRTDSLLAAKEVSALAPEKLARLDLPEERWMELSRGGESLGFVGQRAERADLDGRPGYRIVFRAYTQMSGQTTLIDRTVQTAADLSVERWRQEVITQDSPGKPWQSEGVQTGRTADGNSTVVHRKGKRRWVQEGPLPEGYLPVLVTDLFRRLVDPAQRRAYSFTHYDPDANRTLPTTFRVDGEQADVPGGGRGYPTQQVLGNGLPPTKIWTDAMGRDLRYEAAGGIVAVRSTAGDCRRHWGARAILRTLDVHNEQETEPAEE